MPDSPWLTPAEERAWRGYMLMHPLVDLRISRDLSRDSGLSMADYMVLVSVSEDADRQLRLVELAEVMLWSKSRLGHHLDRMVARGLVLRRQLPTNSRATVIELTEAGWAAIRQAAPLHVRSVRRHLLDLLSADQVAALADITETVLGQVDGVRPDADRSD
ncbi:MarR family winged helix-turn-helix transcriptional regulator [Microlunatus soli]|uniref:DNA-binding transcriptional regulator, MarR family n=1 Tax=Microlunatus soli TaxID=630515 RepID=A0A1H1V3C1_9ACTN|nr:MarR family transcriptional regulator [Microlunatus soli]SDS78981.1 DNA-binding transcriptional regulator, MarR family [Microlunatus soli]